MSALIDMRVELKQHAVGQGGLFSGCLSLDNRRSEIRWIYDCGSNQRDPLMREIASVSSSETIDLLFLSHLDSDHISGVDRLLNRYHVREVVLPYINDDDVLLAVLAQDVVRGRLSGLFVDAVSDLASWFGNHGVKTLTFVRSRGDDAEGNDDLVFPDPDKDREDKSENLIKVGWTKEPIPSEEETTVSEGQGKQTDPPARTQEVTPDAMLGFHESGVLLNWVLVPYVHTPSKQRMKAFRDKLEKTFGKPLDKNAILNEARTEKGRKKIRKCYEKLWRDHNLITMTLYSGTIPDTGYWKTRCTRHFLYEGCLYGDCLLKGDRESGWLLTGDADLGRKKRRKSFLDHYRQMHHCIKVLMMPHHGSRPSFSPLLLKAFPNLRIGYAAAGTNSYGHPHCEVKAAVEKHPKAYFRLVNEDLSTQLIIRLFSYLVK